MACVPGSGRNAAGLIALSSVLFVTSRLSRTVSGGIRIMIASSAMCLAVATLFSTPAELCRSVDTFRASHVRRGQALTVVVPSELCGNSQLVARGVRPNAHVDVSHEVQHSSLLTMLQTQLHDARMVDHFKQ
jgi:hypothetical protein